MPTLAEKDVSTILQCIVFGDFKVGKTVFAATFPRPRFLDLDNGMLSVLWACRQGIVPHRPEDIVYETILEEDFGKRGIVEKATALDRMADFLDRWIEDELDKFDTIVIDSGTALSEYAINSALEQTQAAGRSKMHALSQKAGMRFMDRPDWGGAQNLVQQAVDRCRALPKHFVFICHAQYELTDNGLVKSIRPSLIGKQANDIPKGFDEVYFMEAKSKGQAGVVYQMRTTRDGTVAAGSRLGSLPPVIENPTFAKLMAYIEESKRETATRA